MVNISLMRENPTAAVAGSHFNNGLPIKANFYVAGRTHKTYIYKCKFNHGLHNNNNINADKHTHTHPHTHKILICLIIIKAIVIIRYHL